MKIVFLSFSITASKNWDLQFLVYSCSMRKLLFLPHSYPSPRILHGAMLPPFVPHTHVLLCLLEHQTPFCILGIPCKNTALIKRQKRHQLLSNRNIIPADQSEVSVHKSFFGQKRAGWSWEKKGCTCFLFLWQQYLAAVWSTLPLCSLLSDCFLFATWTSEQGGCMTRSITKYSEYYHPGKRTRATLMSLAPLTKRHYRSIKNAMWTQALTFLRQFKNKQSKSIQQKKRYNLF